MAEKKPISKSYLDLKSKVWDTGLCSGCGACIAVCPADALYFETGGDSTPEAAITVKLLLMMCPVEPAMKCAEA